MRIINEGQYANLFLNEERHYPKFLEPFKSKICMELNKEIYNHTKIKEYSFSYDSKIENEYCNTIKFSVFLDNEGDINDRTKYISTYYNPYGKLVDDKLYNVEININCPYDGKCVDYMILDYSINHELTHLYDDWINLKNGNTSISHNEKIVASTNFLRQMIGYNNELFKGVGYLCYMSLKAERKAFAAQTIGELKSLGCNTFNYKEKIKETVFYNNITKAYKMFCNGINNVDLTSLCQINWFLFYKARTVNIPKYDPQNLDCDGYIEKLKRWADNIYHQTMKLYGSVVSYYIDELNEDINNHRSMWIF